MPQKKECTGTERDVPDANMLKPETLYHATVNKNAVCKEGLKTVKELWKEKKYFTGVGGSNDKFISFTYDESLANDYANDIQTLAGIANGRITPKNIKKYLDAHDQNPKMKKSPSDVWNDINNRTIGTKVHDYDYNGVISDLEKGVFLNKKRIYDHVNGLSNEECAKKITSLTKLSQTTANEMCTSDREELKFINFNIDLPEDRDKIDDDKRQFYLFEITRNSYFGERDKNGGRQNPLFFGGNLYENYKKITPEDVGIIKVLAFVPETVEKAIEKKKYNPYFGNWEYPNGVDVMDINPGEHEIRIHPKYTTKIEVLPVSKKIKQR